MTGKDYLSQEEIDALLEQTSTEGESNAESELHIDQFLNSLEQDTLGEIGNITFGSAATALSTLLGKKVEITTPQVSVIAKEHLDQQFPIPHVAVHVKYVDGFKGINLLVIRTDDAKVIADLMLGGDGTGLKEEELQDIHISAVQEAMNQMMGSSATSMSTIFNRFVNISPPGIDILDFAKDEGPTMLLQDDVLIKVSFRLTIGDLIDSTIMQLLPLPFTKEMVNSLLNASESSEIEFDEQAAQVEATPATPASSAPTPTADPAQPVEEAPVARAPQNLTEAVSGQAPSFGGINQNRDIHVQPAQYASFSNQPNVVSSEPNLNMLLDIPLRVTVELGRTQKLIKDILELSQGSIIELDKLAGEPVDILVNNKLIAKGEVVVIDENFGVRVTDIISQEDRVYKLQ